MTGIDEITGVYIVAYSPPAGGGEIYQDQIGVGKEIKRKGKEKRERKKKGQKIRERKKKEKKKNKKFVPIVDESC